MDKAIGKMVQKTMGKGEKIAPVKSIKLKVKFQKTKGAKKMAKLSVKGRKFNGGAYESARKSHFGLKK